MMNQPILLFLASITGNLGITSLWLLQIKTQAADPTSLLIAGISGLVAALVTVFFIYRKEVKERNISHEEHANKIQDIYEKVVHETNSNIANNNRLTGENIVQVKELREAIQRLPKELREALKERP